MFSKISWPSAISLVAFLALYGFLSWKGIAIPTWLAMAAAGIAHALPGLFSSASEVSK